MALIQKFISVILAIASFFSTLFGGPAIPHGDTVDTDRFELVWADEFDGDTLDSTKWRPDGWAQNSEGSYLRRGGYWNGKMATVQDGYLHIATKYYENGITGNGPAGWYTASITTKETYMPTYGYYECRCILPKGYGLWSAFWLYTGDVGNIGNGGVDGAEIDIFESAFYENSKYPNSVQSAVHYDGYGEYHKSKAYWARVMDNDPYETFNTYALEWNEDEYIFYINGKVASRSDFGGACQVPEAMILSVEVGGSDAVPADDWVGSSIEKNTEPPTDFIVDYVRVYQYK